MKSAGSTKKAVGLALLAFALMAVLPISVWADLSDFNPYTPGSTASGSLTVNAVTGTGLRACPDWSTATVAWTVTALADSIQYEYWINVGDNPALSHTILETSLLADIFNVSANYTLGDIEGPKTNPAGKQGNTGLPEAIYGVKINGGTVDSYVTFYSTHIPMWGDIYGKGGSSCYFYNAGLLDASDLSEAQRYDYAGNVDPSLVDRYVLVPDTQQVPLPGAMILGGLGLGAAGYGLKRKKKTA